MRQRILASAARVFLERGFAGASLSDIAHEAGFSKGAVYSNFESKDDLFLALMDEQIINRTAAARDFVAKSGTGSSFAADLGKLLTDDLKRNADWQRLFFDYWALAMRDPQARERLLGHRRSLRQIITAYTTSLLEEMDLDPGQAQSLMYLILSISNGLAVEELLDPGATPPSLIGDVLDAFLKSARKMPVSKPEENSKAKPAAKSPARKRTPRT